MDEATKQALWISLATSGGSILLSVLLIIRLFVSSRAKIDIAQNEADIEARRAELAERKRFNDGFLAMIDVIQEQQKETAAVAAREIERRRVDDEFQRNYVELAQARTEQINKIIKTMQDQVETDEVLRTTATDTRSKLEAHILETKPAVDVVIAIPETLQRIETKLAAIEKRFDEIPQAIQKDIEPLHKLFDELKAEVTSFATQQRQDAVTIPLDQVDKLLQQMLAKNPPGPNVDPAPPFDPIQQAFKADAHALAVAKEAERRAQIEQPPAATPGPSDISVGEAAL